MLVGAPAAVLFAWLALAVPPTIAAWSAYGELVEALVARHRVPRSPRTFAPGTPVSAKLRYFISSIGDPSASDLNESVARGERQRLIEDLVRTTTDVRIRRLDVARRRWLVAAASLWIGGIPMSMLLVGVVASVGEPMPADGDLRAVLLVVVGWVVFHAFRRRFAGDSR